jgi:hypothetical protein
VQGPGEVVRQPVPVWLMRREARLAPQVKSAAALWAMVWNSLRGRESMSPERLASWSLGQESPERGVSRQQRLWLSRWDCSLRQGLRSRQEAEATPAVQTPIPGPARVTPRSVRDRRSNSPRPERPSSGTSSPPVLTINSYAGRAVDPPRGCEHCTPRCPPSNHRSPIAPCGTDHGSPTGSRRCRVTRFRPTALRSTTLC